MTRQPLMTRLNTTKLVIQKTSILFVPLYPMCFSLIKTEDFVSVPGYLIWDFSAQSPPNIALTILSTFFARTAWLHSSVWMSAF